MNTYTEHFPRISRRILLRNLVAGGLAATTIGGCGLFTPPRPPLKATLLFTYSHHTSGSNALAWSPNGTRIASHSWDKPQGSDGI